MAWHLEHTQVYIKKGQAHRWPSIAQVDILGEVEADMITVDFNGP